MLKSVVIEEKKIKHSPWAGADNLLGLVWFDFCFTALQHIFRSFRARSVNLATLFLGKPPRQFTST